ncbi:hypothetical protein C5C19_00075 [Pseudoclavibacter sp. RFBH5]|nr:hypothetical protein C5C19_00075 [Pseudoclavibacter sp. RFBH5]
MLARPILLWPGLGAIVVFSITAITFTFTTASAPGGSRLTSPPITLADLAGPDTLTQMVGRPVMITGTVILAIAILQITSQYASGFVRIALVYQPRRALWLVGNWLALAAAAIIASVVGAGAAIATALVCAAVWGVDTAAWGHDIVGILGAVGNLALGMTAFAIAGSALAVWLRSPVAALGTGLVYALFENMLQAAAPVGQGLLPVSAFSTVATSGLSGDPYLPSLIATAILLVAIISGTSGLVTSRDVTE